MRKLYFTLLCTCLFAAGVAAQGTIDVPANLDPLAPTVPATNLSAFVDNNPGNTTFILARGGRYYFDSRKEWEFDVAFVAAGIPDGGVDEGMPIIQRFNPGTTNLTSMYEGTGNFTVDGVHLIMGEEGPDAGAYENSSIRPRGVGKRYIFRNSMIEKSRQAVARIEGDSSKSYIENCYVLNMGDYEQFQGNGRLIDVRSTFADSVVITNNVISNILDRLYIGFRQRGNNYFEFTSNTVFNHVGRHGLIQLSNTKTSKINNNLFSNPKMMGTTPSLSDEQIGAAANNITYLFTSDSIPEGGSIEMRNNNIFYTDDVEAYFASADTVQKSPVFGPDFLAVLGDTTDAYFSEEVTLNSVPARGPVLQYTMEAINDRQSQDLTDMMVEPIERMGSAFDNGYLFDFSTFDPCYSDDAISATAATDGGRVGARGICGEATVAVRDILRYNGHLNLKAFPNPTAGAATISYTLSKGGAVSVMLYDATGKQVMTIATGDQVAGEHTVDFNKMNSLPAGMYFVNLFTQEGRMYTRLVKN